MWSVTKCQAACVHVSYVGEALVSGASSAGGCHPMSLSCTITTLATCCHPPSLSHIMPTHGLHVITTGTGYNCAVHVTMTSAHASCSDKFNLLSLCTWEYNSTPAQASSQYLSTFTWIKSIYWIISIFCFFLYILIFKSQWWKSFSLPSLEQVLSIFLSILIIYSNVQSPELPHALRADFIGTGKTNMYSWILKYICCHQWPMRTQLMWWYDMIWCWGC